MIKKLPITEPSITSHPDIALPMSIFSTIPYIDNWLCSEFLQMYSNGIYTKRYNYGFCEIFEPLECIRIPHHLDLGDDIIDFFINFIKNDYYILVFCDNTQISSIHWNDPYLHSVLLYGVDEDAKAFDALAYQNSKLQTFSASFSDMAHAYNSDFAVNFKGRETIFDEQSNEIRRINMESHMLVLYKIRQMTYQHTPINMEKVKWHMLDYLESVNTLSRERPNLGDEFVAWGLDIYDEVKKFYQYQSQKHEYIGFADPYCIYEHKMDWLRKLQYLREHTELSCPNDVLNDLENLIKHGKIFVNLIIKYNIKREGDVSDVIQHVFQQMDLMREFEKNALSRYYDCNRSVFESF